MHSTVSQIYYLLNNGYIYELSLDVFVDYNYNTSLKHIKVTLVSYEQA